MKTALRVAVSVGVAMLISTASAQSPVIEARWGHLADGGPSAIAIDPRNDDFYVIDSAIPAVRRFDRRGRLLSTWRGSGTAELKTPHGVAIDSRGKVWVTDLGAQLVRTFTPDGLLVATWEVDAIAIAIDRDDNVYLADRTVNRVRMFDRSGVVQTTWELSPPKLVSSTALALDSRRRAYLATAQHVVRLDAGGSVVPILNLWPPHGTAAPAVVGSTPAALALDAASRLYVLDRHNHRVLRFGRDGQLERAWGGRGVARGSLDTTRGGGIAVSAGGVVHVADDANYRVQRFSADGALIDVVGGFTGERRLRGPWGLTTDAEGDVYVADTRNHRVVKFNPGGELLARWGWFGREDGELQHPQGVAVDSDGSVYVADRGNARIQKFDRNGAYVLQWRGPEESPDASADRFSPHDIALGPHGNVYVLAHTKVFRFDRAGTPLGSWRFVGSGMRLATDAQGNVYVTSTAQSVFPAPPSIYQVYKFAADGTPLAAWGTDGTADGRLHFPTAVAVDGAGNILVADAAWRPGGGPRVQTFDPGWTLLDGKFLASVNSWPPRAMALDGRGRLFAIVGDGVVRFKWPSPGAKP